MFHVENVVRTSLGPRTSKAARDWSVAAVGAWRMTRPGNTRPSVVQVVSGTFLGLELVVSTVTFVYFWLQLVWFGFVWFVWLVWHGFCQTAIALRGRAPGQGRHLITSVELD